MKVSELRKLKDEELREKINDLNSEYLDKKLSILNNSLSDTSVLQKIKKDTARIHTILNERKDHE